MYTSSAFKRSLCRASAARHGSHAGILTILHKAVRTHVLSLLCSNLIVLLTVLCSKSEL